MTQQTIFWICRGLALALLLLGIFLVGRRERRGLLALLLGFGAVVVFQYVLFPLMTGFVEEQLTALLSAEMFAYALPLCLILIAALYEMLVFSLLALPFKSSLSAPLAGCFGIGYWGCSILYTLVADGMAFLGSASVIFGGSVLDTLCTGLVPLLNLPLYFALSIGAAALASGGGVRFFFRGILWNLVYRLILALPTLTGMEAVLSVVLAGLWGILLLIFSIRAGRSIVTLEELPEKVGFTEDVEAVEEAEAAEEAEDGAADAEPPVGETAQEG